MSNDIKLDKFKTLFNCRFCSNVLAKPITLPCGVSICKSHSNQVADSNCQFCSKRHPKTEYQINEALYMMLELQVNSIKLSPKFDDCKERVDKAKDFVDKIDMVAKDPENFIYEYFEKIKQKVDFQREELKSAIDEYSNEIISEINQKKKHCIKMAKEIEEITKNLENYRTDLNVLIQRFDSFEFNDEKYDDISSKVNIIQPKLEDILEKYKYSLICEKDYEFKVKKVAIENLFGSFISYQGGKSDLKKSTIIKIEQISELLRLCEFPENQKFKLLYKASEDGFNSKSFHEKCDGIKNTFTIVKSINENISGGYTDSAWDSNGRFINGTDSFIFSFTNQVNEPFKAKCTNYQRSIFGNPNYGPIFGKDDLTIYLDSNTNQKSFSHFGSSYEYKTYGETILAGSKNFHTTDIEVYEKLN